MGWLNRYGRGNTPLVKMLGCVLSIVMAVLNYQSEGILAASFFLVLALLFGYEAFAMGIQHRAVRTRERIPFIVVAGILFLIGIIRNTNGGL